MKKSELIEQLKPFDDDAEIVLECLMAPENNQDGSPNQFKNQGIIGKIDMVTKTSGPDQKPQQINLQCNHPKFEE